VFPTTASAPSSQDRTDHAVSDPCPPPRLAPCKPRTYLSTGSHRIASPSVRLGSCSPILLPSPDPAPQRRRGRASEKERPRDRARRCRRTRRRGRAPWCRSRPTPSPPLASPSPSASPSSARHGESAPPLPTCPARSAAPAHPCFSACLHLTALAVCFRSASPGASSSRGAASSGPPSRRPGSHLRTSSGAESRCLDPYYAFGLSRAVVGLSLCC